MSLDKVSEHLFKVRIGPSTRQGGSLTSFLKAFQDVLELEARADLLESEGQRR